MRHGSSKWEYVALINYHTHAVTFVFLIVINCNTLIPHPPLQSTLALLLLLQSKTIVKCAAAMGCGDSLVDYVIGNRELKLAATALGRHS